MGRSSWKSQSCRTCLMRKVKCDKTRPECIRCHVSAVPCKRSSQWTVQEFILAQQLITAPQYQDQLLSSFLRDYLPQKWSGIQTYMTSVSWAEILPSLLQSKSTLIETSVYALTLTHVAMLQQDEYLLAISRQYYNLAIQKVCASQHVRNPHDFIHVALILAMYELYTCVPGDIQSWMVHVRAACSFANQSELSLLTGHDLCRLHTVAFLAGCSGRRKVPLPGPLKTNTSSDVYNNLLDILSKIPVLLEEFEQTKYLHKAACPSQASSLLFKALHIEEELMQWYQKLDQVNEPLFLIQPASLPNGAGKITFRNESVIPLLLLYWLGLVVLYTIVSAALREGSDAATKESAVLDSTDPCNELQLQDSIADTFRSPLAHDNKHSVLACTTRRRGHYAQRIFDSMLDCANKGFGTAIVAALTSYVMHQFCPRPAEDVAYLSEVFGRRGLKFSYA